MKPLLPTLKERKRYILFQVISGEEIEKEIISQTVHDACLRFLGELGMAKAGIQFLQDSWNKSEQKGIIRVSHKYVDHAKAALTLIKEISGHRATFSTTRVSGILAKVK